MKTRWNYSKLLEQALAAPLASSLLEADTVEYLHLKEPFLLEIASPLELLLTPLLPLGFPLTTFRSKKALETILEHLALSLLVRVSPWELV